MTVTLYSLVIELLRIQIGLTVLHVYRCLRLLEGLGDAEYSSLL